MGCHLNRRKSHLCFTGNLQPNTGWEQQRNVDDLFRALGLKDMGKSNIMRICQELDHLAPAFRNQPLEGEYPWRG